MDEIMAKGRKAGRTPAENNNKYQEQKGKL